MYCGYNQETAREAALRYNRNQWPTFPIHNSWGGWGDKYMYPTEPKRAPKPKKEEPKECVINIKVKGDVKVTINVEEV